MAIVKDGMSRLIQTTYLLIENNMKPKVNSPFSFALGKENIKTKNKAHTPPPPKKRTKQNKEKKFFFLSSLDMEISTTPIRTTLVVTCFFILEMFQANFSAEVIWANNSLLFGLLHFSAFSNSIFAQPDFYFFFKRTFF